MAGFRVFLDANVLFPIVQTDLLLQLADLRTFVPLWSTEVMDELVRVLVRTERTTQERAIRRVRMMNEAFPDALVTNWESLVQGIEGLPDRDDRHVVAAAIEGNAAAIVTNNLKDFPASSLALHGLHAKSCDDFLLDVLDLDPGSVRAALSAMVRLRSRPPVTLTQLVEELATGCPNFASSLLGKLEITHEIQ